MRTLPFEEPDPSLVPMAGRRALDRAGLKLSLRAWQGLTLLVRETLASAGAADEVDVERVRTLVATADPPAERIAPLDDPPEGAVPPELARALGPSRTLGDAAWRRLGALERYALWSYARRSRGDKLAAAFDALVGPA